MGEKKRKHVVPKGKAILFLYVSKANAAFVRGKRKTVGMSAYLDSLLNRVRGGKGVGAKKRPSGASVSPPASA